MFFLKDNRKHIKIISGYFEYIRILILICILFTCFIIPFIRFNNKPLIFIDLFERKIYLINNIFWPQDLILLAYIFIILALFLFCISLMYGRIWCGFICPQTLWSRLYTYIEYFIEGNVFQKKNLLKKNIIYVIYKKTYKHIIWLFICILSSIIFISFFNQIYSLIINILKLNINNKEFFWICFFIICTNLNSTILREKICFYICPYSRFQSVMLSENTFIVEYDYKRGELRNNQKNFLSKGDCVNCYQCVDVCPVKIDIRNGLQIECIHCLCCSDACHLIMNRLNRKNLIYFNKINKTKKIEFKRFNGYIIILFIIIFQFFNTIYNRSLFEINLIKDSKYNLYENKLNDDKENYLIKINNKTNKNNVYNIYTNNKIKYFNIKELFLISEEICIIPIQVINKSKKKFFININNINHIKINTKKININENN